PISPQPVTLFVVEHDVELAILACLKVKTIITKNTKTLNASVRGPKLRSNELGCRRECQGPVEQSRVEPRSGLIGNVCDDRFSNTIPVLQGSIDIALKEVDGGKKVVSVGVGGIECERTPQKFSSLRIALLFECNAGEFNWKPLVSRLLAGAISESSFSILPKFQSGESPSVIKVQIGGAVAGRSGKLDKFRPAFLFEICFRLLFIARCLRPQETRNTAGERIPEKAAEPPASSRDLEVGCLHVGRYLRLVDGSVRLRAWVMLTASSCLHVSNLVQIRRGSVSAACVEQDRFAELCRFPRLDL